MGIHHPLSRNLHQRRFCSIFVRPPGHADFSSPARSGARCAESRQNRHAHKNLSHPLSPYLLNSVQNSTTLLRRIRSNSVSLGVRRLDTAFFSRVPRSPRLSVSSALSLSSFFSSLRPLRVAAPCIPRNAPATAPLPASFPALHFQRGHLQTSFQHSSLPADPALAVFLPRLRCFFSRSGSPPKTRRKTERPSLRSRATAAPRATRAPRNKNPLRSQRRLPQGSPCPRQDQQRTRRSPIRSP